MHLVGETEVHLNPVVDVDLNDTVITQAASTRRKYKKSGNMHTLPNVWNSLSPPKKI